MPQPVTRLFPPSEAKVIESGPPDCLQTSNKQNMTQLKTQMHSTPPARDRPGHKLYGYLICHANDQDLLTESQTSAKRAFMLYRLQYVYVYLPTFTESLGLQSLVISKGFQIEDDLCIFIRV